MAKFRLKPDGLARLRAQQTDTQIATALGVHRTTIHRALNHETQPGIPLLAGVMLAYGPKRFNDLFEAVP